MGVKELEEMKNVDVRTVDIRELRDINQVSVDGSLPREERLLDFVQKIGNPFCFICDGIIVKLSFADRGESLENKLVQLVLLMESAWNRRKDYFGRPCNQYTVCQNGSCL